MSHHTEPSEVENAAKCSIRGDVEYPPYEELDDRSLAEVRRFRIDNIGRIRSFPQHMPYSSSKRTLREKTGLESLESKGKLTKKKDQPKNAR